MHVRTFYNVALSRLITTAYRTQPFHQIPAQLNVQQRQYIVNLEHYPELKSKTIDRVQSSYNLNFSGFYQVNRQDGLGAEFVVVTEADPIHKMILSLTRYRFIKIKPIPISILQAICP